MGVTGIANGIGIGPFDLSKPSGSALDVITSSNGAWWVVKERDGSGNLVDQTGGGRNLTLPGGSANPVLLDHTGTSYIWFPGTASNTLTTGGLSNSTAYDYKVWYLDGSTATGQETTDGSGVLTLGGTQTNFNVKKVTRIRVVADGDDPDSGTAVRDILASTADPDATTFTESSSNAATVTINRSTSGYRTEVVAQPLYAFATDDYLSYADAAGFFDIAADEELTLILVGWSRTQGAVAHLISSHSAPSSAGYDLRVFNAGLYASISDGTEVQSNNVSGALSYSVMDTFAVFLDRTADEWTGYTRSSGLFTAGDASALGAVTTAASGLWVGTRGAAAASYADMTLVGAVATKQAITTAAELDDIADALITANGGTT